MQLVGRERRRKGLINRLRRLMYGLLLLAAQGAIAADELAYVGKYKASQVSSTAQQALQFTIQGLVLLHAESPEAPLQGIGYPCIGLDTMTARMQEPSVGLAPLISIAVSESGSVRDGIGFDLAVPDFGKFHLSLFARQNAKTKGKRWSMDLADGKPAGAETKTWSLGGSLEMVRTLEGERHLSFVPELLVELNDQQSRYLPFQASVKISNWRSISERHSLDTRVPQIMFKWRL